MLILNGHDLYYHLLITIFHEIHNNGGFNHYETSYLLLLKLLLSNSFAISNDGFRLKQRTIEKLNYYF